MPENPEGENVGFRKARQASGPQEEWRQWTAADGRKAQEAAFLSCDNGIVQVLTRSGQRAQLPLDRLSEADRQYVASKEKPTAELFEVYQSEPQPLPSPQQSPSRRNNSMPAKPYPDKFQFPLVLFLVMGALLAMEIRGGRASFANPEFMVRAVLVGCLCILLVFGVWRRVFRRA